VCTWYLANKRYYTIIAYFMNLRLQRVNWACPYELRNAKTKFISEITQKKKWTQQNDTDKNLYYKISETTACFGGKFWVLRKGERRSNSWYTFQISLFLILNNFTGLNYNAKRLEFGAWMIIKLEAMKKCHFIRASLSCKMGA